MDTSADVAAIEAVAGDYVEGWYRGDVARIDRALHADLVKRIRTDPEGYGSLREVTKDRMVELTREGGGEDPSAEFVVTVYDVSDEIATARVVSPEYIDLLHLVKGTDGWQIVNVLFRFRS